LTATPISKRPARPAPGGSGRHRARKGEGTRLREQIIAAAQQLLLERGSVAAVSIRDVAERVGVTSPAIYLHFEDKERLFYECCRQGFELFAARLVPVLTSGGSPIQRIKRMGEEYVAFGLDNSQQYLVLFGTVPEGMPESELPNDPGHQTLSGLVTLVAEAKTAGEIRPELDPAPTAAALWAVVHGAVHVVLTRRAAPAIVPVPDEKSIVTTALEIAMAGVTTAKGKRRLAAG